MHSAHASLTRVKTQYGTAATQELLLLYQFSLALQLKPDSPEELLLAVLLSVRFSAQRKKGISLWQYMFRPRSNALVFKRKR